VMRRWKGSSVHGEGGVVLLANGAVGAQTTKLLYRIINIILYYYAACIRT
jgi:hypothetical protein